MQRGRGLGAKPDPMAQLDAAMAESFQELSSSGTGVAPEDVVGTPDGPGRRSPSTAGRQASPGRLPAPRQAERGRDQSGRFLPTNTPSEDDEVDAVAVLSDEPEAPRRATASASRREAPIEADDEADDDDDVLDDDAEADDDDDTAFSTLEDDADEVEGASSLGPEGDDEYEDEPPAQRSKRGSKRDQKLEKLVAAGVKEQVGRVLAERDQLRERESQQQAVLAGSQEFFRSVLGTNEQLAQLQAVALDRTRPVAERDAAAAAHAAYEANRAFAGRYQQGLMMVIQNQQAEEDGKALSQFAQLRALDPAIVREGNRAKTLVHAYRVGMAAAEKALQAKYAAEFTKMKRQIQTLRGSRSEEQVRGGLTRRAGGTLATASGRRANGRVGRPDPMHGVLSNQRGIGAGSLAAFPTDDVLTRIKNGELSLRDIGLAG